MSKSNDRGKIVLEALVKISQMTDAAEMKKAAYEALVAIGVVRLIEEPRVTLQ